MIDIEGKIVLTELDELVDPGHAALVVVDMQVDFIEPDGLFGSLGIDLSMYAESRPRLASTTTCLSPPSSSWSRILPRSSIQPTRAPNLAAWPPSGLNINSRYRRCSDAARERSSASISAVWRLLAAPNFPNVAKK